ncbi:hypothetical protein TH24_09560 [Thalassospira xiamenensis]|nr:hypothetical protein TH24_09560 [Thalassospira xiamenensis]
MIRVVIAPVDNCVDDWPGIVGIDQYFCCESMKLRREAMHWDSILDRKHGQMAENFFINLSQFHSRLRGIVKKLGKDISRQTGNLPMPGTRKNHLKGE